MSDLAAAMSTCARVLFLLHNSCFVMRLVEDDIDEKEQQSIAQALSWFAHVKRKSKCANQKSSAQTQELSTRA